MKMMIIVRAKVRGALLGWRGIMGFEAPQCSQEAKATKQRPPIMMGTSAWALAQGN
jgi:hypothetical protein